MALLGDGPPQPLSRRGGAPSTCALEGAKALGSAHYIAFRPGPSPAVAWHALRITSLRTDWLLPVLVGLEEELEPA